MDLPDWSPLERDYAGEIKSHEAHLQSVSEHPLMPNFNAKNNGAKFTITTINTTSNSGTNVGDSLRSGIKPPPAPVPDNPLSGFLDPLSDPLGAMAINDPLGVSSAGAAADGDSMLDEATLAEMAVAKAEQERLENIETAREVAISAREQELKTPWEMKKKQVLADYSVQGSILLNKDAYDPFEGTGIEDGTETRHLDKYAERLSKLERRHLNEKKVEITQGQFEAHVRKLSDELDTAWAKDERINSLRIASQLSKLLSDTNYPQFYPVMFVLVTDVLERFGRMVYTRLLKKAEEGLNEHQPDASGKKRLKLPENFTSADVPSLARETCRNWFYKISCIKELVPRLFVEATLLKAYRFLSDGEYPAILKRLGTLSRGLGDPLVSAYARTYIIVKGRELAPTEVNYANNMLRDTIYSYKVLRDTHHQIELVRCGIDEARYVRMMSPALEWMLKTVGKDAKKEVFQETLVQYREHCNDAMVLGHIVSSFKGEYFCTGPASMGMVQLIASSIRSCMTSIDVFANFGRQLVINSPSEELRIPILNEIWKLVSKAEPKDIESYIRCAAVWIDVVQRHYSDDELFILLKDISKKLDAAVEEAKAMQAKGATQSDEKILATVKDPFANQRGLVFGAENFRGTGATDEKLLSDNTMRGLEQILTSIVSGSASSVSSSSVLTSEHVLKMLDVFKGYRKVEMCMDVLESYLNTAQTTSDAVLINTLFDIGRTLHDSIDHMSADGDRNQIASILNSFILRIDFGRDLEQQLNMYMECRGIFCNLDKVKDQLVLCVSELAIKALVMMKGRHTKKTSSFAKACLAFCHITIPSIQSVPRRLFLLIHCAKVSLSNQCLPQTDTFLKAAISLIPEMPSAINDSTGSAYSKSVVLKHEDDLASHIRHLLSTLVLTPGHPDHGPFYIVNGLLNALPRYGWDSKGTTPTRCALYIDILSLMCTYSQKKFPYHCDHLESNDMLYCGAPGYTFELQQSIAVCMKEIMALLTAMGKQEGPEAKISQCKLVLDLANRLATSMELTDDLCRFMSKLLELAHQNEGVLIKNEKAYWVGTLDFIGRKASKLSPSNPLVVLLKEIK